IRDSFYDGLGNPMPASSISTLFLFEPGADRNPIPHPNRDITDGKVKFTGGPEYCGISAILSVDGFGTVRLYADNSGPGYKAGSTVELNRELAHSRLTAVQRVTRDAERDGVVVPTQLSDRIAKATAVLQQADKYMNDPKRWVPLAMESLRESLWAGEEIVLARAKHTIQRRGWRNGFLFGCNFFGYPAQGEEYVQKFERLFNFATLPLYWRNFEPEEGTPRYERLDTMLARLEKAKITAKGHPLCWFHRAGCPSWLEGRPFSEWRKHQERRVREIVTRYRGRIRVYDVINEAHDWGNEPGFTSEELIEMTRVVSETTHAADPQAVRVVNNCSLFGEYVAEGRTYLGPQKRRLHTPLQYLRAVIGAGIDFDAVGLQVYYPGHDMFEIATMLDRFAALGKPIHVTELGVASKTEPDERAMIKEPGRAFWHAPWSESVQADWIEQFYTICYAHPAVQAVTWWDFTDAHGHFWPHGGLLRPDLTPKEGYHRLLRLIAEWRTQA
ncbi:MAG: endo-1,4-beta-xylanase, partial [Verrucomicrobiae bacterium]|nr:endo-1,4-beta-xylanase [Verrucomicrobiae bacterium]